MSSFFQFQDQDSHLSDPPVPPSFSISFTTAAETTVPPLRPKMEPKTEPFDDDTPAFTLTGSWNPNSVSRSTTPPYTDSGHLVPADSPAPEAVSSPETADVYSEFARISKLFNSAFSKGGGKRSGGVVDALDANSGAIVPVSADSTVAAPSYKRQKRKLMRCSLMSTNGDHNYEQEMVRKTRLLYNSLRIFSMFDAERRLGPFMRRSERADLRAATLMRERDLWLHSDKKVVGSIPGINVGDVFFYRMEMCVVGLHGQPQAGIDYLISTESDNGCPVATSIIVSGGYEDDEDSGDVLVYSGHGGRDKHNKPCCDQKPEGGNLALLKSMEYGFEVRVIRGLRGDGIRFYVYDGLYKIVASWCDVGKSGFSVFKYRLVRIEGQEKMGSSVFGFANTLRTKPLELRPRGYLTLDLSSKKEAVPVFLFNDVDSDYGPMYFEYLPKAVLPPFLYQSSGSNASGCECVSGCTDNCLCAMKNGGGIPYDNSGFLIRGKPLIFECGANCKCPQNCRNRVSQRGLRHRLEVFRSKGTRWRVRTLDLIQVGSFICEFSGVVLSREQAQVLSMSGDNLIYPGHFAPKWMEWGDLSRVYPNYIKPSYPSLPPLDFAMDVSSMRNVAFYMGHSENPNLMAQFVLYDHNNLMFPRIMFFALEVIPPMKDLTIDYGVPDEYAGKPAICHH